MRCSPTPVTAISPRRNLLTDMDRTLALLIADTAQELQTSSGSKEKEYSGLREHAQQLTDLLIQSMFPSYASQAMLRQASLSSAVGHLQFCLALVLPDPERSEDIIRTLLKELPEIRRQIETDLEAAYAGDPAAQSIDEVILCYPAFTAISTYRLAHILYREGVPTLPRVMSEYAHRLTGIDIHPGAQIGDYFFIDHGTGVVIGETTTIGHHVKLYQHVTLGAKSFDVGEDGTLVKGIKRHPDIGDRVVIYSGATLLGGDTQIGNDCIIGGSVWLTHAVEAGKMVLARSAVVDTPLLRDVSAPAATDSAML